MSRFSPTAEGFRLIFRNPLVPLAEIAWRWSCGAAAWFLAVTFLLEYADTLRVSAVDRLLLGTAQPVLILQAVHRIFEGTAFRFTRAGVLLAVAMTLGWILVASIGRAVTIRGLIDEVAGWSQISGIPAAFFALNFVRAAVTLAAVIIAIGSGFLASGIWASTHASAGDAVRLWFAVLFLAAIAWSALNWFLSTSAVFAAGGDGTFQSIASVVRLCVERPIAVVAPGTWFGLIHFGAFLFATGAAFTVMGAAGVIGAGGVLFLEILIALAYSVAVNFLRVARLAAYVRIVYGPAEDAAIEKLGPVAPESGSSAIDASELILSDMPLPAS